VGETTAPAREDPAARAVQFIRRAEQGDKAALAEVRKLFNDYGALWERTGDLARQARAAWVKLALGDQAVVKEALERKLEAMQRELAGPDPSPLERLLADRVVACWLRAVRRVATEVPGCPSGHVCARRHPIAVSLDASDQPEPAPCPCTRREVL
jgi:hypothetical protein